MTTGAHEVMTIDELQHYLVEDSPGGGTLISKGPYEYCATLSESEFVHNGVCRIATVCSP